jgi:Glycosyltransferase
MVIYGHVNHLKLNDIINKCHVYVLPSIEDGYGLTVTQAAAAGCPCIVTENTGASDFVKRNKCGFIVPIRDSNSIMEKLQTLSDNKNLFTEMSYNASSNAKSQSWSDYVEKLDNIVLNYKKNQKT